MHEIIWTFDKGVSKYSTFAAVQRKRSLRDSELVWGRSDDSKRHPLPPQPQAVRHKFDEWDRVPSQ